MPAIRAILLAVGIVPCLTAGEPLHVRIDRAIGVGNAGFEKQASPRSSDAEFLRRVYLDLAGTIPSAEQSRQFLDDRAPNKRTKLIDELLASPNFARQMQRVFDVMLMERRQDKHVPAEQWRSFLYDAFLDNRPWDELVREILSADGTDASSRPAAKFYLDREAEPNLITRDTGRLFLAMDLQCAQCHDHPLVDDYLQADYYGLQAFVNSGFLFTDKSRTAVYAEKFEPQVSFTSVFTKKKGSTGPRVPGMTPVSLPNFTGGEEYVIKPAKDVRPVPRISLRAKLATELTRRENLYFRNNIANRLWAMMMGRGLVEPVDMQSSTNPPSHPELLDLLGEEMVRTEFDLRAFLRELALTATYQRSSERPADASEYDPKTFGAALLKPLSPEQFGCAMLQATGMVGVESAALKEQMKKKDPKFGPFLWLDPVRRERQLTARLDDQLAAFQRVFAGPSGQQESDFGANVEQALFLRNGDLLRSWIAPRTGNLTDRLRTVPTEAVAEELYLSVFSRRPSRLEADQVSEYLILHKDRQAAVEDLVWAMATSAEFRFNH